jgi:uncharacterized membrane protein
MLRNSAAITMLRSGGIEFNDDDLPAEADLFYFSFGIGVTLLASLLQ